MSVKAVLVLLSFLLLLALLKHKRGGEIEGNIEGGRALLFSTHTNIALFPCPPSGGAI